jgi:hypothetical protein
VGRLSGEHTPVRERIGETLMLMRLGIDGAARQDAVLDEPTGESMIASSQHASATWRDGPVRDCWTVAGMRLSVWPRHGS